MELCFILGYGSQKEDWYNELVGVWSDSFGSVYSRSRAVNSVLFDTASFHRPLHTWTQGRRARVS